MTAALPLFGDARDWRELRDELRHSATWRRDQPRDTLLRVEGYGHAVRMAEASAMQFLDDHGFAPADRSARRVHHASGGLSEIRFWSGPHGAEARTTTKKGGVDDA
ncbi:hypothetical protein [Tsukamurella tyrosinosolvens]|uniref:hypothetical protein n=1 Tax=Tsukamurella tyrosinosolvens TaxID=57704 RepID=UPI000791C2C6|nr:hypothetical protein [Tsukamurella tyrosinosolvens]KXO91083.1 hypothetical protein AXK58_21880 [Tsukamurella tyrosinosolvens]